MADRAAERRTGDLVAIDGAYQFEALWAGPAVQRFWHHSKLRCVDALLPPAPGDFVLDVGCGSGVVTSHLAQRGARAVGIDANPEAIEFARRQFGACARFQLGLVDDGFTVDAPVDKAYCLEVVEHVYRPQALSMLVRIRETLRPGGRLLLTTPNYRSLWPVIEWLMDRSGRFAEMAGAQHVEHYHGRRLAELCAEAGLQLVTMRSMGALSPWLAFLSWRAAERALGRELSSPLLAGPVLVCVASKPQPAVEESNGG
jgi:2-polyprenyl-3-methyl-5-hydroxy-6-metoxy-1,4-benzoquinol methylase